MPLRATQSARLQGAGPRLREKEGTPRGGGGGVGGGRNHLPACLLAGTHVRGQRELPFVSFLVFGWIFYSCT